MSFLSINGNLILQGVQEVAHHPNVRFSYLGVQEVAHHPNVRFSYLIQI